MNKKSLRNKKHIKKISLALIELVKKNVTTKDKDLFRSGLSVWLYNYPLWYRKFLEKQIGLKINSERNLKIKKEDLNNSILKFKKELIKDTRAKLFILNDSRLFLDKKRSLARKINFSRRDLVKEENYIALADLVNRAAMHSKDWEEFRINYSKKFTKLIEENKGFLTISKKVCKKLNNAVGKRKKVVFIDTGLQGTLALFLIEILKRFNPKIEGDIKLFCVYPWLTKLFKGKFYTNDSRYLFQLERTAELKILKNKTKVLKTQIFII